MTKHQKKMIKEVLKLFQKKNFRDPKEEMFRDIISLCVFAVLLIGLFIAIHCSLNIYISPDKSQQTQPTSIEQKR